MQELKIVSVTALVLGLTLASARSASADDSTGYIGLGAGRSLSRLDDAKIADELISPGIAATSIDTGSHKNAYKLFGGYQFNRYFATETSYFDLGKFGFTTTTPSGAENGTIDVRGFAVDAVALIPFTGQLSAFAKLGAAEAQTRDFFSSTGGAGIDAGPQQWHLNPKIGAGCNI